MMTNRQFEACKAWARKNIAELDGVDGWKNREIGTIYAALEAGLRRPESNSAFDALVMLEDLYKQSREAKL